MDVKGVTRDTKTNAITKPIKLGELFKDFVKSNEKRHIVHHDSVSSFYIDGKFSF